MKKVIIKNSFSLSNNYTPKGGVRGGGQRCESEVRIKGEVKGEGQMRGSEVWDGAEGNGELHEGRGDPRGGGQRCMRVRGADQRHILRWG